MSPSNLGSESKTRAASSQRVIKDHLFLYVCLVASGVAVLILVSLLTAILLKGAPVLSWDFLRNSHVENRPELSGISQALVGSVVLCLICGLVAMPVGIGTAIYLEEFQPQRRWIRSFRSIVQLNINNLAGVPSIVYGILGVSVFVYMFGLFQPIQVNQIPAFEVGAEYYYQAKTVANRRKGIEGQLFSFPATDPQQAIFEINRPLQATDSQGRTFELNLIEDTASLPDNPELLSRTVRSGTRASRFSKLSPTYFHLPLGKSLLAAGLTLGLVVLPIVIIASQESIRAVPETLREASIGLGATRWQTVYGVVLPQALPRIMTGAILAMSRAIGEAAPVIAVMGGVLGTTRGLSNLMESAPVLPVTIYKWSSHQNAEYEKLAAAGILVLLVALLFINSAAVAIRYRLNQKLGD